MGVYGTQAVYEHKRCTRHGVTVADMRSIDRVLKLAERRQMTQADLARALGVERQDVTNWKARGMPANRLAAAAQTLGCSVDYLLGRGPPPEIDNQGRTPREIIGKQLLDLFWSLPEQRRDDLLALANMWANQEAGEEPSPRNPYPAKLKRSP